jgi:uncharacterized cupredoxin-like copper-binding protein
MKKYLAGIALISITAILAIGCGSDTTSTPTTTASAPAPAAQTLDVTLGDMTITAPKTVDAGKYTVTASNTDAIVHEVVFIQTDTPAAKLPTESDGSASEKDAVGEVADVPANSSDTTTVTLKPGHYALICNLPGHYAAGMYTDRTVQ